MPFPPTVLLPLTLPGLLQYVLTTQTGTASTTLVICSSRETFLRDLVQSLQDAQNGEKDGSLQDLATPTLHNLSTTRHVKLAFCASVQALLAYLTAYGRGGNAQMVERGQKARLILVNPIALHAPTPSFSAQGLSRTFAAAAEMALESGVSLQVVECQGSRRSVKQQGDEDVDLANRDGEEHGATWEAEAELEDTEKDPWEQEVSILNVSARRFTSNGGERAWAGRTVKAKRVAARWFYFQQLDTAQTREGQG
ncbi:hypothetical protein EK21DRAFT_63105 [Setomelanomma holmii]|uniref:Uncharacterized protein n=1 Tax=Setomelanomma holmii TaxID=210430 RepID=A0A9P4LLF1_9PLEO|nr:hypothetical protein EK21DRAFT_63105 [Setomelanomma holmii]